MNVAFLANSFHLKKTKSTDFLIDLLRQWFGSLHVIPHKEAWSYLPGTHWDLILSFQHLWSIAELEAFGAVRTVLVPMFDDCPKDRSFWEPYLGFRILSFSKTLGADLAAWGHDVMTVQYWQPVPEQSVTDFRGLRGFFWPRTEALDWSCVRTLIEGTSWESFHLHVTNAEGRSSVPSEEDQRILSLIQTSWFDDAADLNRAVAGSNVYFAPRRSEGIGQAVLEALALGLCVVAPDAPTMNEYIVSGQNGWLYDPDHPRPLDFSLAEALGRRARQDALDGRARWEACKPALRAFLLESPRPRRRRFRPWIRLKGRSLAWLRNVYRWFKGRVRG